MNNPVPVIAEPVVPFSRVKVEGVDNENVDKAKVAPSLTVKGELVNVLLVLSVIVPVFFMITPPVPAKEVIHSSEEAVLFVAVLYCNVAEAP